MKPVDCTQTEMTYLAREFEYTHTPTDEIIEPVLLPATAARTTQEMLRSTTPDEERTEALVYWAGSQVGHGGVVTTVIAPLVTAEYGRVETSPEENATIVRWLDEHGLVLLGQAHTHPPDGGVRHSLGDDLYTFSVFEGHVSVVVPDFARTTRAFAVEWGVHRFLDGAFRFLGTMPRQKHLCIVPAALDRRVFPS
ncbi:hypothetical protein [Candidatus Palauibacter sp.]|uniref:hypothetical protein n=1 Tax=Candidatus Palauibacter sp. TaxID=3101350 RepID=UPI003B023A96